MTTDELLESAREWATANHPNRALLRMTLEFADEEKVKLLMPVETELEYSDQLHPVEQAILDTLSAAVGEQVTIKKLLADVRKATAKSEATVYRYVRRLKTEKLISEGVGGYVLVTRNLKAE